MKCIGGKTVKYLILQPSDIVLLLIGRISTIVDDGGGDAIPLTDVEMKSRPSIHISRMKGGSPNQVPYANRVIRWRSRRQRGRVTTPQLTNQRGRIQSGMGVPIEGMDIHLERGRGGNGGGREGREMTRTCKCVRRKGLILYLRFIWDWDGTDGRSCYWYSNASFDIINVLQTVWL